MPRAKPKNGKIPISAMLPQSLKAQLDQMAFQTRRTRSAYIQIALEAQFKKDGAK